MTEEFHSELQALLLADAGAGARERLLASCRRRSVAGVSCFSFSLDEPDPRTVRVIWTEDLSGELAGVPLDEVARALIDAIPAWLVRWMLRRTRPFHLRRVTRFIPFTATVVLRATAPSGRRRLGDFIVVPFRHRGQGYGAFIGLFEPASERVAEELVTLASACMARQPWQEDNLGAQPVLNERQLECLQWIVAGKSLGETALITGMSYANVRYHLERAKEQTELGSLQQLVAHAAVEYGLSPLGPGYTDRRNKWTAAKLSAAGASEPR